jgi:hypothetical protein
MFLITIYLSYFYKIRKSGEINQIIQINKMSAFEKMASAFKSKEFDAISSSLLSSESSPSIFTFTQNKKSYSYDVTFVKTFSGGKSGDNVLLVKIDEHEYVLKIFNKTKKRDKLISQIKEVSEHLDTNELFKRDGKKGYMPCPIMYCYGYLSISGISDVSLYMIIEYVKGVELYSVLEQYCSKNPEISEISEISEMSEKRVDILTIILELFYFIGTIMMNGKTHCDLHPRNILITPCLKPCPLDFSSFTSLSVKLPIKNYTIKVIDFGLAEGRGIPCSKIRETTQALNTLRIHCTSSSSYMALILGEINLGSGNADLNFFCQILRICASFDERVAKIGIEKIDDISKEFDKLEMFDKKALKSILSRILKILMSIETEKEVSKFSKKRSKSATKKSKRKTKKRYV